MTETPFENVENDDDPFNLASLSVEDVGPVVEPIIPDMKAGRKRRNLFTSVSEPGKRVRTRVTVPKRKGQFIAPLTQLYASVGTMLLPFDQSCGMTIVSNAEQCAKALDDLAYQNEAVRRALWHLTQTTAWGAVLAAHAPILLAIAIHHVPAVKKAMGESLVASMNGQGSHE